MPKKNAFFYFMIDFKRREEAKGVQFADLGEVSPIAGAAWETMNASERQPYVQRAKTMHPTTTNNISSSLKNVADEQAKIEMQKQVITERLNYAKAQNALDEEPFHLISLKYFGRTLQGAYLPAELGMVKYSLRHGVMDRTHFYINPGDIPVGAAFSVQTHTEKTHKLPLPPNALGLQNNVDIAIKFFRFFPMKDKLPVLYTNKQTLPIVEGMLHKMLEIHTKHSELFLSPLSELFYRLREATAQHSKQISPFRSVEIAQYILDMDTYAFASGISCDYHDKHLLMNHCALSQATRWGYILSKYCCADMGIECIPGKHIPLPIEKPLYEIVAAEGSLEPCISGIASLSMKSKPSRNAAYENSSSVQKPDNLKSVKQASNETTTRPIDLQIKQENTDEKRAVVEKAAEKSDTKSSEETTTRAIDLLIEQENSAAKRAVVEKATEKSDETLRNGTDLLVKQKNPHATQTVVKTETQKSDTKSSDETTTRAIDLRIKQENPAAKRAVVEKATENSDETTTRAIDLLIKQENPATKSAVVESSSWLKRRIEKALQNKSVAKDALSNQPHTGDVTLSADNNLAISGSDKQEMVCPGRGNIFPTTMEHMRLREYFAFRRGRMSRRGHTPRPKYIDT